MSSALHYRLALPDDPRIDHFDCGDPEVTHFIVKRQWWSERKGHSPTTYQFFTEENGSVVGYAAAATKSAPFPEDGSESRAKVLVVFVFGVVSVYQGQRNPRALDESFATSMMKILEVLAQDSDCRALQLWVREDNARAIAFYKKLDFNPDPNGAVQHNRGAPHLTMRKLLPPV